jgi:hypothetical protein
MSAWEGPRGQVPCGAGTTWGYNHRKMLEDVGSTREKTIHKKKWMCLVSKLIDKMLRFKLN